MAGPRTRACSSRGARPPSARPPSARPTTGNENQFGGIQSGFSNATGNRNRFIGSLSGQANAPGTDPTAPGNTSGPASGGLRNPTAFGFFFTINVSNNIRLGNNAVTVMEGQQGFSNPSDTRLKHRVRADMPGPALRAASR